MKKILIIAGISLFAAGCDKEKITGCVRCKIDAYEIKVNVTPNESKPINYMAKNEEACGDASAKSLIEKFNPGTNSELGRSYTRYELDSSDRSNIKIIQIVSKCEEI